MQQVQETGQAQEVERVRAVSGENLLGDQIVTYCDSFSFSTLSNVLEL